MNAKFLRTLTIMLQIVIIAAIMLVDICGLASTSDKDITKALIESLVRCVSTLAFTIFYYVSVSDSFGSESIFFPQYLLFLSVSELRICEIVQNALNFYLIPNQHIVFILIVSAFMLGFSVIGFCLLPSASTKETNLFAILSLVGSFAIAQYGPKATNISNTWNSKGLLALLVLFYLIGLVTAIVQAIIESSKIQKVRYIVSVPLLINNYINLVYNTNSMNLFGTVLSIVSLCLFILLVKINSSKQ